MSEDKHFFSRFNLKKILSEFKGKENKEMYTKIFMLTFPAFLELFLSSLFNMLDMVMIGNWRPDFAGAISSVGITNQPFFLLISFFAAVNVGTTTLVAWKVGSGNAREASDVLKQSLMINFFLSTILTVVGIITAPHIMNFLSKDEIVITLATEYFRITCTSLPFMALTLATTGALRGAGQIKIPMMYNLIANFLKVILNMLLINGRLGFPELGVKGAALSSTISRIIACSIALGYVFCFKKSAIRLSFKTSWKPKLETIKMLFSIGLPSSLEQIVLQSGLLIYSRIVAGLGVNTLDAHNIVANINSLAFSVSQAFSISTTTLVGQAVGANNYTLAEKYTYFTRRTARIITFLIAVTLVTFSRQLCGIYTKVDETINIALPVFFIMAAIQFMQSSQMSTAGALRGSGDTVFPLYSAMFGIWLFRVPMAFLLTRLLTPYNLGLVGAWASFFLDQSVRNFIIKRRFSSGKWKTIKSKKESKRLKALKENAVSAKK